MKVITKWEYSVKSEAERLLQCAHQIAIGFYRVNNFTVLPANHKIKSIHIAIFPDLPYHKIPRFWEQVKRLNISSFPLKFDKNLVDQTIRLMEKSKLPTPNYENIRKTWQKAQDEVLKEIGRVIPAKKNLIKKIVVYPTSFGTSSSFNLLDRKDSHGTVCIYLRDDQGILAIAESILSSINYNDVLYDLEGVWSESELLVDWLVTHSSLSEILKKYEKKSDYIGTIKGIRSVQHAELLRKSEEFYTKLGLPVFNKSFSLNGLTPEIHKKPVENLNPKERILLKILIQKENVVVSFDEISDQLYQNENEFSLWGLAKIVERLRTKLEQNGISGSFIQTLRGQGYVLKN